ncbi:hypothetical protein P152DRAFT_27999 [Eremomyces bilateralis CBS 781.70]|uniref:Uncharacterized protein n=1 Tax=Eremomyces bilateralis CBS 781.70 TaxID=1392243 RepID=A0A6G1G315_9PEZI|nr:uncharacterized protein P152DRAFT_27999 [Eremomyces bilateralis CBS 781.70]KAF1812199.1 hypothetical protein P152DRAFT_27999 [Eremomyces bilateralis CBS 781.70]
MLLESVSFPSRESGIADRELHEATVPHLDHCLLNAGQFSLMPAGSHGEPKINLLTLFNPTSLFLLQEQIENSAKCGYVYANRGRFDQAAHHLRMVKDALIWVLGRNNEKTMMAMLRLEAVCWGLG